MVLWWNKMCAINTLSVVFVIEHITGLTEVIYFEDKILLNEPGDSENK